MSSSSEKDAVTTVVVHHDEEYSKRASEALKELGFSVSSACDIGETVRIFEKLVSPSIIVIEEDFPEMRGDRLIAFMNERKRFPVLPIVVTKCNDEKCEEDCLRRGAFNCIAERRMENGVEVFNLGSVFRTRIQHAATWLQKEMMPKLDHLTHAYLREDGLRYFQYVCKRAKRFKKPVSLIFIDIDNFKVFNNSHGHAVGDIALEEMGKAILQHVRDIDAVVRYGGDEFLIILPEATKWDARIVARRIKSYVEKIEVPVKGSVVRVTISLGIMTLLPKDLAKLESTETLYKDLIDPVDQKMYRNKARQKERRITTLPHKEEA